MPGGLLIEGPRIGCLKEQHHVVEDWPQEGHAELHVLLQLLAPRPHLPRKSCSYCIAPSEDSLSFVVVYFMSHHRTHRSYWDNTHARTDVFAAARRGAP